MKDEELTVHFLSLAASLAAAAMQGLGQVENPVTQKKEKDLGSVKYSIDLLMMLQEKTKNNCTKQEADFLNETVSKLQMAYVHETNRKGRAEAGPTEGKETPSCRGPARATRLVARRSAESFHRRSTWPIVSSRTRARRDG